jgi:hypothetical protein
MAMEFHTPELRTLSALMVLALIIASATIVVPSLQAVWRAGYLQRESRRLADVVIHGASNAERDRAISRAVLDIDLEHSEVVIRALMVTIKDPVAWIRMASAISLSTWIPKSAIASGVDRGAGR